MFPTLLSDFRFAKKRRATCRHLLCRRRRRRERENCDDWKGMGELSQYEAMRGVRFSRCFSRYLGHWPRASLANVGCPKIGGFDFDTLNGGEGRVSPQQRGSQEAKTFARKE